MYVNEILRAKLADEGRKCCVCLHIYVINKYFLFTLNILVNVSLYKVKIHVTLRNNIISMTSW